MTGVIRKCTKCGQEFLSGGPWPQSTCDICSPRRMWTQVPWAKSDTAARPAPSEGADLARDRDTQTEG